MDREKVINALECCVEKVGTCEQIKCPYEKVSGKWCIDLVLEDALELLKEQPTIVRCKDCKHHGEDTCSAGAGIAFPPPDDWFCADGERQEGR